MNVYLLITLNLLLIALVSYLIVDSSNEFKLIQAQPLCLQKEANYQLCAKCYKRDSKAVRDRAIKIEGYEHINVLKIAEQQTYLTCHDYLQFISTQKDLKNERQISLEPLNSLPQIMSEIKAVFQVNSDKTMLVLPSYSQFVIYTHGDQSSGKTKVTAPNTENYTNINFYFAYGFNFILLLILVAWIADNSFLAEQSTPIKISLTFIAILMELWLLEISGQVCLYLCRLLVLSIGLLRLKVNNFKVMGFFAIGLLFTYFQVTVPIYIVLTLILMCYYGKSQSQSSQIQRYLIIFYSILLLNHLYVYNFVFLLNDFRNVAIELCVIITVPLGLFLLPNEKSYKPYRPVDPEIRSISLSGYDQEEPTNI